MGASKPVPGADATMLIIRAWREHGTSAPGLRAQVTSRRRIDDDESDVGWATTPDQVVEQVRAWLDAYLAD